MEVGTNSRTEVPLNSTDGFVPEFDGEDKVAEALAALKAKLENNNNDNETKIINKISTKYYVP